VDVIFGHSGLYIGVAKRAGSQSDSSKGSTGGKVMMSTIAVFAMGTEAKLGRGAELCCGQICVAINNDTERQAVRIWVTVELLILYMLNICS